VVNGNGAALGEIMPVYKPIDRQRMIADYLDAFRKANPGSRAPFVSFARGLFRMKAGKPGMPWEGRAYRHRDLKKMTQTLLERAGVSNSNGVSK